MALVCLGRGGQASYLAHSTASESFASRFQLVTATIGRNVLSGHAQQHLPLQVPLALAMIDRSCYVGTLNSICLVCFPFCIVAEERIPRYYT